MIKIISPLIVVFTAILSNQGFITEKQNLSFYQNSVSNYEMTIYELTLISKQRFTYNSKNLNFSLHFFESQSEANLPSILKI